MHHDLLFSLHSKSAKRAIVIGAIALVAFYVVIPNIHAFGIDIHTAVPKNLWLYLLAFVIFMVTFLSTSLSYRFLAFKKVIVGQILLVQYASVPLNLLLPAGIGNIGINYRYLRGRGHSPSTSGVIAGVNNVLGIVGNISLLIVLVAIFGINAKVIGIYADHATVLLVILAVLVVIAAGLVWFFFSRMRFARHLRRSLIGALRQYRKHPLKPLASYGCGLLQATMTALTFYIVLNAYGIHLNFPLTYMIFSLGVLVGAITPTPGGIGGVEASLTAGIVAVHGAGTGMALAAVLAYRVVSYWLPVTLGVLALGF
ncbi:flippase-like domain-containing protein, partial [Patescibacteria group bacterium]|nr:flippase-like domain-containing protein [Patescibacteria group bacterium]